METNTEEKAPTIGQKKGTKTQRILAHLQAGFSIDNIIAVRLFQTTRLGSIIHELKKDHVIISTRKSNDPSSLHTYTYDRPKKKGPQEFHTLPYKG